jgi:hypothetical protein
MTLHEKREKAIEALKSANRDILTATLYQQKCFEHLWNLLDADESDSDNDAAEDAGEERIKQVE